MDMVQIKNFAGTTLQTGCATGDTTLYINPLDTAKFAGMLLTPGDWTVAALFRKGDAGYVYEYVKVTGVSGNELTVERGFEGTTAKTWNAGDSLELRITAGILDAVQSQEWKRLKTAGGSVAVATFMDSTHCTITGDQTAFLAPRRACRAIQTENAYGYIVSAAYDGGTDKTTVEVKNIVLDEGLVVLDVGMFVDAAPEYIHAATADVAASLEAAYRDSVIGAARSGLAVVDHQHALADITDAGTAAGKNVGTGPDDVPVNADIPMPDISPALNEIGLTNLRLAYSLGWSAYQLLNGVVDEYEDATGVDAVNSVNAQYTEDGDYYSPSKSGDTNLCTGGTPSASGVVGGYPVENAFDGSISSWTLLTSTSNSWAEYMFAQPYAINSVRIYTSIGSSEARVNSFRVEYYDGSAWVSVFSGNCADADGWNSFVFSNTVSATRWRIFVLSCYSGSYARINRIEMIQQATENMQLISVAFTSATIPESVYCIGLVPTAMAADARLDISRDGGSTWTEVELTDYAMYSATLRMLTGTADISAQPSGATMRYRWRNVPGKDVQIHGTCVQW